MREIPKKNYIIFAIVIVLSLGVVAYCVNWYRMSQTLEESKVMNGVVSEIKSDELSSYLLDNPNVIVYIAPSNGTINLDFENALHDFIIKEELTDEFIYLDSSMITNSQVYRDYEDQYLSDTLKKQSIDLSVTPNLWYFHDGQILDVMNTVSRVSSIQDAKYFLEKNGVY